MLTVPHVVLQVDKLLGPGNQYVTAAKMLLQNSEAMVSIDMPAGPSEVLVIADAQASPAHVAADLLSQAEHGPDSQACPCPAMSCPLKCLRPFFNQASSKLGRALPSNKCIISFYFMEVISVFSLPTRPTVSWRTLSTTVWQFAGGVGGSARSGLGGCCT